ncbi:MAG: ATP-binding cassette domain-containing protein [Terriglobales bacterium]
MGAEATARSALNPALVKAFGLGKKYMQRAPFSRKRFVIDALADVELEVAPGSLTALIGESGSGKSTLARCLSLVEKPDRGEIWFEEKEISRSTGRELASLRPKIQMVHQDSAGALNPRFTAAQIIAEPLEIQQLEAGPRLRTRACELMEEVGLSANWADRHPLELSGGQRQRLAIARAIALKPAFLILDESLSGLDLSTQAQILNLLLDLQQSHSLTYLLISHDVSLVGQIADSIAVMHQGKIVERGSRHEIFSNPRHAHTRELLGSVRRVESSFRTAQAGGGR